MLGFGKLEGLAGDEAVLRTLREMRAGGVSAGFVSLVADAPLLTIGREGVSVTGAFAPGEADAEFRRQLAAARDVLPRAEARIVSSMAEWHAARRQGQTAAWLACEGSEFLDGDPGRVDVLWEAGITRFAIRSTSSEGLLPDWRCGWRRE